jgi:hypothetical protein
MRSSPTWRRRPAFFTRDIGSFLRIVNGWHPRPMRHIKGQILKDTHRPPSPCHTPKRRARYAAELQASVVDSFRPQHSVFWPRRRNLHLSLVSSLLDDNAR